MDNTPSAPPNSSSAGNAPDIADNTPNTFAGRGIGGPPSHTIAQWMHKPAVWVAAGVVGIILLGGVSHYLGAAFRGKPPIEPPSAGSPSSATGKQSISGST